MSNDLNNEDKVYIRTRQIGCPGYEVLPPVTPTSEEQEEIEHNVQLDAGTEPQFDRDGCFTLPNGDCIGFKCYHRATELREPLPEFDEPLY